MLLLAFVAVVENFGRRRVSILWRIEGIWQFLRRQKGRDKLIRPGFGSSQPPGLSETPGLCHGLSSL